MAIPRQDVERHALDAEFHEERGADVGDPPELQLARPDLNRGIELAIDRDDLRLADLRMFQEEDSLRQILDDGKEPVETIDNDATRHPSADLLLDEAVGMRMIPEQARSLTISNRDVHLVIESLTRVNVNEHVVAVASR